MEETLQSVEMKRGRPAKAAASAALAATAISPMLISKRIRQVMAGPWR